MDEISPEELAEALENFDYENAPKGAKMLDLLKQAVIAKRLREEIAKGAQS